MDDKPTMPISGEIPEKNIISTISSSTPVKGTGFQYDILQKVIVKRNQSSLIPLLQSKAIAQLISVYNEGVDPKRPMQTLEFKNTIDKILEEGPISIFKENFEGEAMLPFMEINEIQRIPFAVDQSLEITKEFKEEARELDQIELYKIIYTKYYYFKRTTYNIKNIADFPKKLIIEHPKDSLWKLYDTETPQEETFNYYRFQYEIPTASTKILVVKERKLISESQSFNGVNKATLDEWLTLKLIKSTQYEFLIQFVNIMGEIYALQRERQEIDQKRVQISEEQSRIRSIMDVLSDSEGEKKLRQRYIKKFETRESQIDTMLNRIKIIDDEIYAKQNKMQELMNTGYTN
jgi:hypothetical protein